MLHKWRFFDRWVGDDGAHSLLPLDQLGKLVISHISLHPPYIKILGSQLSESFLLGNESLQGSSGSDASGAFGIARLKIAAKFVARNSGKVFACFWC